MGLFESICMGLVYAILYLPPIYLGWRFFWKRGLKGWAYGTWAACLAGPVAYIVFGIGYLANRGIQQACPQCGAATHSGKKLSTTREGEPLKEPILAWLAIIGGGIFALAVVIAVVVFLTNGTGLGGHFATFGMAAVLGISGVTWGTTQLNKMRDRSNVITTYDLKCSACGHAWQHKVEPLEQSRVK